MVARGIPIITNAVIIRIGVPYSINTLGSIIIPTDTKKIAANKFLTGFTSASILSPLDVSANIDPIINAPRAAENPTCTASKTIRRHSAIETTSKVSSFNKLFALFKNVGIKKMPPTNHSVKKNKSFKIWILKSTPENC
jgi:hypothetical protein